MRELYFVGVVVKILNIAEFLCPFSPKVQDWVLIASSLNSEKSAATIGSDKKETTGITFDRGLLRGIFAGD